MGKLWYRSIGRLLIFEQLNAGEFLSRIYDKNMAIGCAEYMLLLIADVRETDK